MKKRDAQLAHAHRRAAERLGVSLSDSYIKRLAQMVRDQKGEFECRKSNRISIWRVDGKRVAYDKKRGTIASILPCELKGSES